MQQVTACAGAGVRAAADAGGRRCFGRVCVWGGGWYWGPSAGMATRQQLYRGNPFTATPAPTRRWSSPLSDPDPWTSSSTWLFLNVACRVPRARAQQGQAAQRLPQRHHPLHLHRLGRLVRAGLPARGHPGERGGGWGRRKPRCPARPGKARQGEARPAQAAQRQAPFARVCVQEPQPPAAAAAALWPHQSRPPAASKQPVERVCVCLCVCGIRGGGQCSSHWLEWLRPCSPPPHLRRSLPLPLPACPLRLARPQQEGYELVETHDGRGAVIVVDYVVSHMHPAHVLWACDCVGVRACGCEVAACVLRACVMQVPCADHGNMCDGAVWCVKSRACR